MTNEIKLTSMIKILISLRPCDLLTVMEWLCHRYGPFDVVKSRPFSFLMVNVIITTCATCGSGTVYISRTSHGFISIVNVIQFIIFFILWYGPLFVYSSFFFSRQMYYQFYNLGFIISALLSSNIYWTEQKSYKQENNILI